MNLEKEYKVTVFDLHKYLTKKNDIQVTALFKNQQNNTLHSVSKEAEKYLTEAGTLDDVNDNHPKAVRKKSK